jgi:hypothetical protein
MLVKVGGGASRKAVDVQGQGRVETGVLEHKLFG